MVYRLGNLCASYQITVMKKILKFKWHKTKPITQLLVDQSDWKVKNKYKQKGAEKKETRQKKIKQQSTHNIFVLLFEN